MPHKALQRMAESAAELNRSTQNREGRAIYRGLRGEDVLLKKDDKKLRTEDRGRRAENRIALELLRKPYIRISKS